MFYMYMFQMYVMGSAYLICMESTVNNAAESAFVGRVGQPICKDFGLQIV